MNFVERGAVRRIYELHLHFTSPVGGRAGARFHFSQNAAEQATDAESGDVGDERDDDGQGGPLGRARVPDRREVEHRVPRGVHHAGAARDVRVRPVARAQLAQQRRRPAPREGLDEHQRRDLGRDARRREGGGQGCLQAVGQPARLEQFRQHEHGGDVGEQVLQKGQRPRRALVFITRQRQLNFISLQKLAAHHTFKIVL